MAKSLEARLKALGESAEKEFLEDMEWYGRMSALEMWSDRIDGFSDYVSLQNYIERQGLPPDFGKIPKINSTSYKSQSQVLVEEFANYVFRLKTGEAAKDQRIKELEMKIRYLEAQLKAESRGGSPRIMSLIEEMKKV